MKLTQISWKEMVPGKIYLTKRLNRIIKLNDDYIFVLSTQHFLKLSEKDKQHVFYEYPFGYPKQSLLDEELTYGASAVEAQIQSGRAEREVILKKPEAILRKVKKMFENYQTDFKQQLKNL